MIAVKDHIQIPEVVKEVIDLFETHGEKEYFGEGINQLQHAFQTAELAELAGQDEDTILAAFLHDIGHLCVVDEKLQSMADLGVLKHEQVAGSYLKNRGFSRKVVQLVESHVDAKRYLVFTDPDYYATLSDASRRTLEYQGGPMMIQEARRFERKPHFFSALRLRKWDEQAKNPSIQVHDLEKYRDLCYQHLIANKWYQKIGFLFF